MDRPAIPSAPHDGGCLCGAVRWRLDARPLAVNACHCMDCKKLTGATNLLMILAERAAFTTRGATQAYVKRADSGREVAIQRCRSCGTRLWHEPSSSPTLVFIAAGTLDDPSWVVPTSHIWVERVSPGVVFQEDCLLVHGQPADRTALFEAFKQVYG